MLAPGQPLVLNRSHPLNKGMANFFLCDWQGAQPFYTDYGPYRQTVSAAIGTPVKVSGFPANTAAVQYTVSTAYNSHPRLSILTGAPAFSVICNLWLETSPTSTADYWGKWDNGGGSTQQFVRYNAGLQYFLTNNSTTANYTISSGNLKLGDWNQIAFCADGVNINAYANGLYIGQVALAGPYLPSDSVAWGIGFGRGTACGARIRALRYWNRPLVLGDIRADYQLWKSNWSGLWVPTPNRTIFGPASAGGDATVNLSGVSGAGVLGTLSPRADASPTLTGVSGAAALGTLTYTASVTYTLTGVSGAGTLGTFTVLSGTVVSLSGVSGAAALGTLGIRADASPTLGGVSGTGAVGTFTVQTGGSVTVNLSGVSGAAALGTLTPSASATVTLTGQSGAGVVGTLQVLTGTVVQLVGQSGAGVVGSLTVIAGSVPPVAGYSQWLYAGQGTDVSGDGQAVGSWAGSGTSPFTVTQATGTKKPLLKLAAQNGLPVIRFDGVDDGLKAVVSLSQPMTVFIAYRMIAVGGGQKCVLGQGDTLDFVSNSASQVRIYGGSQVTASDATQTFFRVSTGVLSSQSGGNSYLYLNGVLVGSGNIGTNGLTTFRLCNYADGTTNNANADVGEVLIYPSALNSTDRSAVEAWMIARWIPSTTVVLTSVAATGVVGTFTIVGTGPPPDTWPAEAIPVDARATTAVVEARAVTVLVEVEQMDIPTVDRYGTDDLVYSFDFSRWLFLGSDPLASAVVTASPTGLTLSGVSIATGGKAALVRVQGGASGTTYTLTCVGTTQAGYDVTGQVQIVCA